MGQSIQFQPKFLVQRKCIVVRYCSPIGLGIVLNGMEFLHGSTKLLPRTLASRREPEK
jgi:hypothetical protein